MKRLRSLLAVGVLLTLLMGAASYSLSRHQAEADSLAPGPVPVTSPLPQDGLVLMDGALVIKPLSPEQGTPNGMTIMSREQAVKLGRSIDTADIPVTAVLGSVTMPEDFTYDPSGLSKSRPIRDMAAWVLTFSLPKPVDVSIGGRPGEDGPAVMASHDTMILDAYTGEYIRGFYSP